MKTLNYLLRIYPFPLGRVRLFLRLEFKSLEEFNLSHIVSRFSIEKFDGKLSAAERFREFEHECTRCKVVNDKEKIKCLKLLLKEGRTEWCRSTSLKLSNDDWSEWKNFLLSVFCDKVWSGVQYAHAFEILIWFFSRVCLKKSMLLEIEKNQKYQE